MISKIIIEARERGKAKNKINHHHKIFSNKGKIKSQHMLLLGFVSLLWVLFRTGTKHTRIVYPCQRAALANSVFMLQISIPSAIIGLFMGSKRFLEQKGKILAMIVLLGSTIVISVPFWDSLPTVGAINPNQEVRLVLNPRNATVFPASNVYVVNGRGYASVSILINLMGIHGLLFYKSATTGPNMGPTGLIATDDVVLIKINEEWSERGGTNTDVLKELIQAIVAHPDGFVGEIVVADNGQWQGNMDWPQSNAENISQSTQDVVNMFSSRYRVSTYTWMPIRMIRVQEYSTGDMMDGYLRIIPPDPVTGIYVTYPKFQTAYGTKISYKNGIWNGATYENRLKVINLPVLKSHQSYGVTASLKHYMGVQSEQTAGGLGNGHYTVGNGGMGTLFVQTRYPTLNIIDAVWVNANPPPESLSGPYTPYGRATRTNAILASTDPVALDYWAAKHVLVQAASIIGYNDTHTLDPDSSNSSGVIGEAFGVWLNRTKNVIVNAGYQATTNENRMNVYVHVRSPTVPGDINNDSKTDGKDIALAAKAYGTSPGNPRWDPRVDVNLDQKADGKDISFIAKYFGQH